MLPKLKLKSCRNKDCNKDIQIFMTPFKIFLRQALMIIVIIIIPTGFILFFHAVLICLLCLFHTLILLLLFVHFNINNEARLNILHDSFLFYFFRGTWINEFAYLLLLSHDFSRNKLCYQTRFAAPQTSVMWFSMSF